MKEKPDKQEKEVVQKLQRYDKFELILNSDKEDQILMIKMLADELQLTNITQAVPKLKVNSYNGVKNHCETVKIGNTTFAVIKGNIKK